MAALPVLMRMRCCFHRFFGLEKVHPFDSCKFKRIVQVLQSEGLVTQKQVRVSTCANQTYTCSCPKGAIKTSARSCRSVHYAMTAAACSRRAAAEFVICVQTLLWSSLWRRAAGDARGGDRRAAAGCAHSGVFGPAAQQLPQGEFQDCKSAPYC